MVSAFISRTASTTSLPAESLTATEIVAWCTSSPIYLASFMRALLVVGVDENDQALLQKGALYNAFTGHWAKLATNSYVRFFSLMDATLALDLARGCPSFS